MRKIRAKTLLMLLLLPGVGLAEAVADSLPESMELIYKVSLGAAELGSLSSKLERRGDHYEVTAETRAEGMASILLGGTVREICRFSIDRNQVTPDSYRIIREGRDAFDRSASFDCEGRRVLFSNGMNVVISDGYIVDNCSLPFAFIIGGASTFEQRTLHIVGGNKVRRFEIPDISREQLNTSLGEFDTVRIEHVRFERPDRKLSVWLAPQRHNLPIKIVEKRKSRPDTTMILKSVEGL